MEVPPPIPSSGSIHPMLGYPRNYHWSLTRHFSNPWGPTLAFPFHHKWFCKNENYIMQVLNTVLDREHGYHDSFLTLQSLHTLPTRGNHLDVYIRFLRHVNQGEITTRPLQCSTSTQLHPLRFPPPGATLPGGPLLRHVVFLWLLPLPTPHTHQWRSHTEANKLVS